jgi:hypothetical protein
LQNSCRQGFVVEDARVADVIRAHKRLQRVPCIGFVSQLLTFVLTVNGTRPAAIEVVCIISFTLENFFASA